MEGLFFSQIEFMTPEYDACVRLRDELLRKPLRLKFTEEQLESENDQFHFGIFDINQELLACLSFQKIENNLIKMRQVAVDDALQGKGIGTYLVNEAEQWAKSHNYTTIILHARESAVAFYLKSDYIKSGEPFFEVNIPHWKMIKILK